MVEMMFAKSVAELLEEHRLTIAQLTEKSGLEEGVVIAIATGCWTPSPAQRKAIVDVFGVDIDEIAWGHKTPVQHIWGQGPG